MNPAVKQDILRRVNVELRKLSGRERALIVLSLVAVAGYILFTCYASIKQKFVEQAAEIQRVEDLRREVLGNSEGTREPGTLARYLELRTRKSALEAQFKEVEIKEGVRSHLEAALRSKAKVTERYDIKDAPTKEFGADYELAPFTVKFTAVSMQGAVDFLSELVQGRHPLVLTELDLRKGRGGEKLDVTSEVLSIRKVK